MSDDFDESSVEASTLVDLLIWRACNQPARLAYTFLLDGEKDEVHITYGELDRRARSIAARLQRTAAPGERVLLLYPPGLDFISAYFGCLYAGCVAVPAYPPRLNRSFERLESISRNAKAAVTLTVAPILSKIKTRLPSGSELTGLSWLATDEIPISDADKWRAAPIDENSLAFLQYTSGSTGEPKGVMVSHANLMHNERLIRLAFRQTAQAITVGWLPLYHDTGLIGNVLQPLFTGGRCILMSPMAFLQSPFRWLQAISYYKATTSGGPNFAYELCVRRITEEQQAQIDLRSWTVAFNGAEPVRWETLERFAKKFERCGFRREVFYPCYGLAEATLFVTGSRALKDTEKPPTVTKIRSDELAIHHQAVEAADDAEPVSVVMSCGRVATDQEALVIVDPQTLTRVADGSVGEIWVSGASVARGYWNRPEETTATFRAHLADSGDGPFLRTGDLGFLKDGELYVTGRLKDLIIIHGVNHYPQDIELTVERTHSALRQGCGAAFSVEICGEERLVVVQEIGQRQNADLSTLIEEIRQSISQEHELQAHSIVLIRAGSIHKTSSGKIQRHACRKEFLAHTLDVVAQWQETLTDDSEAVLVPIPIESDEEAVKTLLTSLLATRLGVEISKIDISEPITRYGLDSLTAIEVQGQIETLLGVVLPLSRLFHNVSIAELTSEIQRLRKQPSVSPAHKIRLVETPEVVHPTSFGQRALWFLHQLAPKSAAYHIARAVRITSPLDVPALERALGKLLCRHAAFRTGFKILNEEPFQEIHEQVDSDFVVRDASLWSEVQLHDFLSEEARRPFDLRQVPLLRATLLKRSETDHVFLLTVHHIISDLWSWEIFMWDLVTFYSHETKLTEDLPPPVTMQYIDFVRWQNEMLAEPEGERLFDYWSKELEGAPTVLNLLGDRPRPLEQSLRGDSISFRLSEKLLSPLRELAKNQGATLYTILLTAFQLLLHRYTQQSDLLVGSLSAGRSSVELSSVVGYFVNPIVLRSRTSAGLTFTDFLKQSQKTVLMALEHQNYPFSLLVERLQPNRSPSHSPFFQVMFILQKPHHFKEAASFVLGEPGAKINFNGLAMESVPLRLESSQFDLTLMMVESDGVLAGSLEYNTDLFERATMERLVGHYRQLLEAIGAGPGQRITELPLLSSEEEQTMVQSWNQTRREYPTEVCLHELFEQQVARTPSATALVYEGEELSYRELNARANQLARLLRKRQVGAETLVGVLMERSVALVVTLLGVLKAGAAYVPLEPTYPEERLRFMIGDSGVGVVLTHEGVTRAPRAAVAETGAAVLVWEELREELSGASAREVGRVAEADNVAYVIYTSGSTAQPKGVQITHRGICNRLQWMQEAYGLSGADRVLQKTPYNFDVSVWEFFWPLLTGATLVVARPGGHQDREYLQELISVTGITTLHFVPSMLRVFLEGQQSWRPGSLRRVICSGEAFPVELQQRFFDLLGEVELHNLYGPTEASVDVTFWQCRAAERSQLVPIGAPIANTQIYILDKDHHVVPVGVAGELYVGGVGLARGYVNRASLTAERFIPNPFNGVFGERLYATGDLARWQTDGNIEFLGRIDHQVKIRGFRIELGEIETALARHPLVQAVVVIANEDESDQHHSLVAYVVSSQEGALNANMLRRFLQEHLPVYMVPRVFVFIDALPLTSNGKLDRKRLPASGNARPDIDTGLVLPRSPLEATLAEIWKDVLKIDQVGVHDNFFELGGDSMHSIRVLSRLHNTFEVKLPSSVIFAAPTIAELAVAIAQSQIEASQTGETTDLLEELERFTR